MLSDSERQTLREMERRLSAEVPDFVRRFDFPGPTRRRVAWRRWLRPGVILAELIAALTIVDPQPLTDSQIAALSAIRVPRSETP